MTITEINSILTCMEDLLRSAGLWRWEAALSRHRQGLALNPDRALADIVGMYGGAGSFNDVILYRDGKLLTVENAEFDALRDKLFEMCRKVKAKS
jgi:hypothetical protein